MKDKPFSHSASALMNRNWVLKRKRRKIPGAPSLANDTSASSAKGTTDSPSHRSASKKKGNDGYYYECVICDIGGNLLCCDTCPRTYHLQCLDPPLKRIPTGKWQCPKCCCQRTDPLKQMSNLDSISKRARSKLTSKKALGGLKSLAPDNVTRIFGGSVLARRRSSSAGRSDLSQQTDLSEKPESSQMDLDSTIQHDLALAGGSSLCTASCMNVHDERKAETSPFTQSGERNSINPEDEVEPHSTCANPGQNDEMTEDKHVLSGDCDRQRNGVVLAIGATKEIDRKRRQKANNKARGKKHRTDKGKHSSTASKKYVSRTRRGTHEASRTQPRPIIVDRSVSASSKEGGRSNSAQLKDEDLPAEVSEPLDDSNKTAIELFPVCKASRQAEYQQVDRVLGCRVQVHNVSSSCCISVALLDQMQSDESLIPENQNMQPEEHYTCDNSLEVVAENLLETLSDLNKSYKDEALKNDVKTGNIRVYKRAMARELQEENSTDFLVKDSNNLDSSVINGEPQDGSGATMDGFGEGHEKLVIDEADAGIGLKSKNIGEIPTEKVKEADTESEMNVKARNKERKIALVESRSSDGVKTCYEFLVKWAGKSHIHNSWISEARLKILAKRKLENYKAKYGTSVLNICEEKWKQPQRVLSLRDSMDGSCEVFVKWTGLPYDECTWERLDEPVIKTCSHLIDLFHQLECQTLEKDAKKGEYMGKEDHKQAEIVTLTEQPRELQGGSLFPHQLEALNWLRKCWHKSKNVILADEMGLGKTVSAIAFLSSLYFEFKVNLPSLVLVPLSTMPNWLAEFSLWAPDLYVVDYHGCAKARAIIRQYEWHACDPCVSNKRTASYKFNVLLTTYEMVLADSSHLRGVPWEVLVVDEGHRLKNSGSKLFSLLNTFSFQHRVLLTGTPLQNNIGEMYNLLNFLQPTSFPSLMSFEEKFNDLTTAQKVEELKKLVAPHMLRRLKRDAMQNIPPKTERMVPVELSSIQAEYYRAMLTKNYQILRNIGKGVAQQSMLNIVMQLRKVCNHPYLIPGTEPESGSAEFLHEMRIKASAKLTLLHSMLKLLHKEGHRVLIFSQMTKLLDILEDYLTIEFGPKTYERVDGSVSVGDRQAAIARFNQDKSRFVFLLSTRSCGLGINLATADTVIIYDSDFNPHADIQAMNRAHRIGQSNRLLVYRLVVRASVEERILQLAKKKLMLDQLFVNKSGSQKEVEDILRWGTEELFNSSPNMNGTETGESNSSREDVLMDIEHKHRKRGGGLGDVYKDKCTDGGNKIVWDENAVLKLLDRSDLQPGINDVAEGEMENDMLGAVKSLEWNDETTEEQREGEPPVFADDISAQSSEKKEDNAPNSTEENEWDRLLRVRWEKYQIEEEAALGRGKRQRRAVSYREAYTLHPNETVVESGGEDEREPEPEPGREYTPAGRAFKVKYGRLRARQKERLAKRNIVEESHPSEGVSQPGSPPHQWPSTNKDADQSIQSVQLDKEKSSIMDVEDDKVAIPSDALKSNNETLISPGKSSKRKMSKLNLHANHSDIGFPDNDCQGTGYGNSLPTNNLLPVLGLCAPNASQLDSCCRNFARSNGKQGRPGSGPEFPFSLDPSSRHAIQTESNSQENVDKFRLPDVTPEVQHQCPRSISTDIRFPFRPYPLAISRENVGDLVESSGSTFADFQEKMSLPKLPFDEKLLPGFALPAKGMGSSHRGLFPNLSLGSRLDAVKDSMQDLPTMPLLPNLKFPPEAPRYHQPEKETPPTLSLGQLPSYVASFPENHRRVLENIMMRTGSGLPNLCKKRPKVDSWSEDELDCLWLGVRRHGRGNWDAMLRDPRLTFLKYKTPAELAARWEEEQRKLLNGLSVDVAKSSKSAKSIKSSLFPAIPDGMMTRALQGSRLILPPKFQSHLTDMKLGFGDPATGLPRFEPSEQLSLQNESFPPIPAWNPDNFPGHSSLGRMDRPGTSADAPKEKTFMRNSVGAGNFGSIGLNSSGSCELSRREDEYGAMKYGKLPTFLDRSLHGLLSFHNSVVSSESDPNKDADLSHERGKEIAENSLSKNKLPHWLREAVRTPAKTVDPSLPPAVSAIAQSVRVLYGEDKPAIPPFEVPRPPPPRPKDPRLHLRKKKKRKSHMFRHVRTDMAEGSNFQSNNPPSIAAPLAPQVELLTQSISGAPELNLTYADTNLPLVNIHSNMMTSTSASHLIPPNDTSTGLSPSPAVLQLVASSVAPGPGTHVASGSGMASPSKLVKLALPRYDDRVPYPVPQVAMEKGGAKQTQPFNIEGKGKAVGQDEPDSQDSSKTSTEPCQAEQPDHEEMSSEGTVSDHPPTPSEQEA